MKFENRYSRLDRFLHKVAFSYPALQKSMVDVEDQLNSKLLKLPSPDKPVFITSLPRAGTTLLLDVLVQSGSFYTHTYREMPFLMIPLLWNSLSGKFKKNLHNMERAHDDQMEVGLDSVEAFEESLWYAYWPEKYKDGMIRVWGAQEQDQECEFDEFFKRHIIKLGVSRNDGAPTSQRYLSKNNANISRLRKLTHLFPDARIIVPFRNPFDHVSSMLKQHENFLKIHAEDAFSKQYMKDLGHFDFGANFRPINFNNWLNGFENFDSHDPNFWLQYWCTAVTHILNGSGYTILPLSYERLCSNPLSSLASLEEVLGLSETSLQHQASRFRERTKYSLDENQYNTALFDEANELYEKLLLRSIN